MKLCAWFHGVETYSSSNLWRGSPTSSEMDGQLAEALGCSELCEEGAQTRFPADFQYLPSKIDCYDLTISKYMTEKV